MSKRSPERSIDSDGARPSSSWRSSEPLRIAGPIAISSPSKRCSCCVSDTFAEKPACSIRRMTGSTSPVSQLASPDGWLEATTRSPAKDARSPTLRTPLASTRVRPGRLAAKLSTCQLPPSGRAAIRTSRMVVSLAMMAGSDISTRPGKGGGGRRDRKVLRAAMRSRAEIGAAFEFASPSFAVTSTCCPLAISRNSGSGPVSTVASPVTI